MEWYHFLIFALLAMIVIIAVWIGLRLGKKIPNGEIRSWQKLERIPTYRILALDKKPPFDLPPYLVVTAGKSLLLATLPLHRSHEMKEGLLFQIKDMEGRPYFYIYGQDSE